jgi:hypothetical protein
MTAAMTERAQLGRGQGIGIEFTASVVRGVALGRETDGRLRAAAEVGIASARDDRAVLDALVRLRAELGGARGPTRVALFPPGSTMHRIDVTGRSGPELNALRSGLERDHRVSSTVLIDDGPRRWMMAVRWDEQVVRRLEELVERAGFVDVAIDPSPVAVARVVVPGTTSLRRDAAVDESFEVVLRGVPVIACTVESVGREIPGLEVATAPVSIAVFEELAEPVEIVAEVTRTIDDQPMRREFTLVLADDPYPPYPTHDIRAPERQCVALGAAAGAAGLSGRIRPIDMMIPAPTASESLDRPWAIERMSSVPVKSPPSPVSQTKRLVGRVLPRRRR